MRKYYLFFFVMVFASVQFNAYAESDPVYCVPQGVNNTITNAKWLSGADARYIKTISVTGANFNGATVENFTVNVESGPDRTPVVYYDRTSNILNTTLGDKLTVKWTKSANMTWMHYYVYVDYNNDGVFDETTEAVTWTYYQGKNSKGVTVGEGTDFLQAPEFTIPETAKLGKTRIRFKVDWDCKHPCENTAANNYMYKNAGSVIDFTINIAKVKIPVVTITEPADGTLSIVKENGDAVISGTEVPSGTKLTITATSSSADKHLKYLLVNGEPVYTNEVTVTDDMTISAVFTSDWYIKYDASLGGTVALTKKSDGGVIENETDLVPNTEVNLALTPDVGYEIKTVTINGEDALGLFTEENNYTMTLTMTQHQDIKVVFAKKNYAVKFLASKHGALFVKKNNIDITNGELIEHGTELVISVLPDDDAALTAFVINKENKFEDIKNTLTMTITVEDTLNIKAEFAVPTFIISCNMTGKGKVSIIEIDNDDEPTGVIYEVGDPIDQLTKLQLVFTPEEGYSLGGITEKIGEDEPTEINVSDLINNTYELGWISDNMLYSVAFNPPVGITNSQDDLLISYDAQSATLTLSEEAEASIIDLSGKVVRNITESATSLNELSDGIYFVKAATMTKQKTIKIMKK